MSDFSERRLETRRGLPFLVREGGAGAPLVYLHGLVGLRSDEALLAALAEHRRVIAPIWPGFGEDEGEEQIEDMLDFALHGLDVLDAVGVREAQLVGHSFGGMVAAEMASLENARFDKLGLLAPFGLWIDEHPIADVFATLPFDLPKLLFADAELGQKVLTAGLDFSDNEALTSFMVANARRMGTAGKVLFPIPNRRLSKRLYRIKADTLIVWGAQDALIPPLYAERWQREIEGAQRVQLDAAGHMLSAERPAEVAEALLKFLA